MIVRAILQDHNLVNNFDFFNDFKNTLTWLRRQSGASEIVQKLEWAAVIYNWTEKIGAMSHYDMARLKRFAYLGHPVFNREYPLHEIFEKRFTELGGMTTEISKQVGREVSNLKPKGNINNV